MIDYLSLFILAVFVMALGWLSRRAWRAKQSIVKWLGGGLAAILTVAVSVALVAAMYGYWKLNRSYDNPVSDISVSITPEKIQRGAKLAILCADCHAPDEGQPMTGNDFLDDGAPPIGTFFAPNLTPVHLADWSDGEIIRAIREGVHRSGRSLLIMPSGFFRNLSDADAEAIVAYLRSLPPEGEDTPPNRLNALGAVMVLSLPIFEAQSPIIESVTSPPPSATAEYGAYAASFTCEGCHGADLMGDPKFEAPPLLAIPLAWSEDQFIAFIRTGTRPDGTSVNEDLMSWKVLSDFFSEDDELRAIYAHLEAVSTQSIHGNPGGE